VRVPLRRQPGANLLVVSEEATGLALTHATLASLLRIEGARADVIDLLGVDDSVIDAFRDRSEAVSVSRRRRAASVLAEAAAVVATRHELEEYSSPAHIVVVNGLKMLRDPDEVVDDGRTYAELLEIIAKDGPEVGVHLVVLADSPSTVERRLPRQVLREFGARIVTRMGRDDSDRLIDNDMAAELRPFQAALYDEIDGHLVRLRSYQPAGERWRASLAGGEPDASGPATPIT
jgi:hypothetical protein